MKRFISIILCLILSLTIFSVVGCGGRKEEGGTIRIVIETKNTSTYNKWFKEFETLYADKEYKVVVTPVADGAVQGKQDNMTIQGTPPDVVIGGDVHVMSQSRNLVSLDSFIERDADEVDIDDFIPQVIDACKYQDKCYYLPLFFNTSLLYYNKTLYENYNIDNPNDTIGYPTSSWTYDDFMANAKKLTIGSKGSYSQWGSSSTIGWWGEWLIHVRQHGGEVMDSDGFITLDTSEALAGFESYLGKMNGENKVAYTVGELEMGGFAGKKTAMEYGGHVNNWFDYCNIKDFNWDVELLPTVNGNRVGEFAVEGLGIHKESKNKEGAWALIKYLTRKKTGEELANYPLVSCRVSEKNELLAIPKAERKVPQNLEAVYESLQYNRILPQQSYFTYVVNQIVQKELTKAVEGLCSASTALQTATENANKYIRATYL